MGCIDNTHVSGVPLFHRQRNSAAARRDLPSRLPRVTLTLRAALHAASFAQERHYPLRVACASWMQIGRNVRLRAANKGSAQPSGGCGRRGGTGVYVGTCRFRAPAVPAWRLRSRFDRCSKRVTECDARLTAAPVIGPMKARPGRSCRQRLDRHANGRNHRAGRPSASLPAQCCARCRTSVVASRHPRHDEKCERCTF